MFRAKIVFQSTSNWLIIGRYCRLTQNDRLAENSTTTYYPYEASTASQLECNVYNNNSAAIGIAIYQMF